MVAGLMTTMDTYFGEIFGPRWLETLKPALLQPTKKVYVRQGSESLEISESRVDGAYGLDRASIEPVYSLDLAAEQNFLDLCAAPGGKALMALFLTNCQLAVRLNDSSKDRVARLRAVLFDYLPEENVKRLSITCGDGALIGMRQKETFDRVLADVPCSAERHHLQDGDESEWNLKTSKRLAVRQHSLLCSALDSTAPGGRVVYSTCSLSPLENDGVINKLLKSRKDEFEIVSSLRELGEPTEHGRLILPDTCDGFGPIYYSILQKN
jgi:16S rRNA C967 or C1407 C5-methylase (RsmB/RsmF family)